MSNLNNLIDTFSIGINSKELPVQTANYDVYTRIYEQCDIVKYLVEERKAVVNANGWDIKCKLFTSEVRNRNYAWRIYQILSNLDLNKSINQYTKITSIYGQSFVRYQDGQFLIETPDKYKVWFDSFTQKYVKYQVFNYQNYQEVKLEDVYIFQDTECDTAFCASPIDSCFIWVLLYLHSAEINNNLVSGGGVGSIVAIFEKEMQSVLNESAGDENDPKLTKGKQLLESFKRMLAKGISTLTSGQRKESSSHNIAFLAGLKELKELGQNNQDLSLEMLLNYAEKAIHRGFNVVQTTEKATYSNAKTFNYIKWDLIGKSREAQFAQYVNKFVLPKLGIEVSDKLYFEFNKPNDPDEITKNEFAIKSLETQIKVSTNSEYKAQLINEYRDSIGLEPIDIKLFEVDIELATPKKEGFFLSKLEEFEQKPTPIETALKSGAYKRTERDNKGQTVSKGLLINFENGIKKQLEAVLEQIKDAKTPDEANNSLVLSFPKLETFYSINTLKKDLYQFLDPVVLELESIKENFASNSIPDYLLDIADTEAEATLKGFGDRPSVNVETQKQVLAYIGKQETMDKLITGFTDFMAKLTTDRASIIGENAVANVTETSRSQIYTKEGFTVERWLTVADERTCPICKGNESLGVQPINSMLCPGHIRCRCSKIFGRDASWIT